MRTLQRKGNGQEYGRVLDVVLTILWSALPDGHIDFVKRRSCEDTGLNLDDANGREWQ